MGIGNAETLMGVEIEKYKKIGLFKKPKNQLLNFLDLTPDEKVLINLRLFPLAYGAAYGLAKIDGPEVEARLLKLSVSDEKEGIYAAIALGFMKNQEIVPRLVFLLKHSNEFKARIKDSWVGAMDSHIIRILGAYRNNALAEETFRKHVKPYLGSILSRYLIQREYHEVEWEIVDKYGWEKFLDSDAKKFAFSFRSVSWWDLDYNTSCPFESDLDIEKLRNDILDKIWHELASNEFRSIGSM